MATQSCASQRKQWGLVQGDCLLHLGAVWQSLSHPVALDSRQALPLSQAQQVDAIVLLVPSRGADLLLEDVRCKDADPPGRSLSDFSQSSFTSMQGILKWECIFRNEDHYRRREETLATLLFARVWLAQWQPPGG